MKPQENILSLAKFHGSRIPPYNIHVIMTLTLFVVCNGYSCRAFNYLRPPVPWMQSDDFQTTAESVCEVCVRRLNECANSGYQAFPPRPEPGNKARPSTCAQTPPTTILPWWELACSVKLFEAISTLCYYLLYSVCRVSLNAYLKTQVWLEEYT